MGWHQALNPSDELTYAQLIERVETNPELCFVMHKVALLLSGSQIPQCPSAV